MNKYTSYLHLLENLDGVTEALSFVESIIMSSRIGKLPGPAALAVLAKTRDPGEYTVYRGVSLGSATREQRIKYNGIRLGDPIPKEFAGVDGAQASLHTSKSASVAMTYARGGAVELVFKIVVPSTRVLFDSTNIGRAFDKGVVPPDTLKYFKGEKEVMLSHGPELPGTVHHIRVR